MALDLKELNTKIQEVEKWLTEEYFGIRTGQATPTLLDSVRVEAYGSKMPIKQLASIGIEDPRTLRIVPYDMSQAKEIERAISNSDLGVSAGADDKGIRLSFPELTSERRTELLKLVKAKLEEGRVSVKRIRDEAWENVQKQEKAKEISEDDKFRIKEEMQKLIDEGNKRLQLIAEKKEFDLKI